MPTTLTSTGIQYPSGEIQLTRYGPQMVSTIGDSVIGASIATISNIPDHQKITIHFYSTNIDLSGGTPAHSLVAKTSDNDTFYYAGASDGVFTRMTSDGTLGFTYATQNASSTNLIGGYTVPTLLGDGAICELVYMGSQDSKIKYSVSVNDLSGPGGVFYSGIVECVSSTQKISTIEFAAGQPFASFMAVQVVIT